MKFQYLATGIALSVCSALGCQVYADDLKLTGTLSAVPGRLKIPYPASTSETTVTEKFAVWSKGKHARLDIDGGTSVLFDGETSTVTVLDSTTRTYYKEPLKSWKHSVELGKRYPVTVSASNAAPTDRLQEITSPGIEYAVPISVTRGGSLTEELTFMHANATPDDVLVFGGYPSRKHFIEGSLILSARSFGTGSMTMICIGSTKVAPNMDENYSHLKSHERFAYHINGDLWLGNDNGFTLDKKDNPFWAEALVSAWNIGPMTNSVADKLVKSRELPWQANLTIDCPSTDSGGMGEGNLVIHDTDVTVYSLLTSLTSISNVNLDSSRFVVPSGYTQVPPPVDPAYATPAK